MFSTRTTPRSTWSSRRWSQVRLSREMVLHADDIPLARHCTSFQNTAAHLLLLDPSIGQSKRFVLRDIDQAWGDLHIFKWKQLLSSAFKKEASEMESCAWLPQEGLGGGLKERLEGPAGRSAESKGWWRRHPGPLLPRLPQPSSTENCLPFLRRNPEPQHWGPSFCN